MKEIKYIPAILIFFFFACGRSSISEDKAEQDANGNSNIAIERDFSTDTLNYEQKELFGKRAIQKLEDYYGYIELFTNKKYDITLRHHARKLAAELFSDKQGIEQVLDSLSTIISDSVTTSISNISIRTEVINTTDSIYKGVISFNEKFQKHTEEKSIGFIIKKTNKSFGQEQNMVWETFLEKNLPNSN